ncbi:hypothetical protein ACI6QG_16855 [Roseococcus sp. DSY-14]|uniref:hypothetical protein n=1 Tax=Roseococcus sp. DSY-14 TaxID=3369650 RepID=UPI00387B732A
MLLPPAPPCRPPLRRSAPHEWRPLTGVELHWLGQVLASCGLRDGGPGRPGGEDVLARAEACLEACARRLRWAEAVTETAPAMAPDSLRRCFARWARRGVWRQALRAMRFAGAPSAAMEWFVCLAFRRAWRVHGLAGVVEARRCGFASALRAPPSWLPDPDMSGYWWAAVVRPLAGPLAAMDRAMNRLVRAMLHLGRAHHGVRAIPAWARRGW